MDETLIGRAWERRGLEEIRRSNTPELVAIYGRRRVGKTFLINRFFGKEKIFFELTGQKDGTLPEQLGNFADTFGMAFAGGHRIADPESWGQALRMLAAEIDRRKVGGKVVVFFDELPWLAGRRSGFLGALDHFWNTWGSRKRNLIVVICGSAASWMIERVINDRGGLHNRVTRRIRLEPFTLAEAREYLHTRRVRLSDKQILELYLATGGIPLYLRHVERGRPVAQNIDQLCFTRDGFLRDEFNNLYSSLFENSGVHVDVVRALAKTRRGLTRGELLDRTRLSTGGGASEVLRALEESSFISSTVPFGRRKKDALYRLVDEYSLFYLTWIEKAPRTVFSPQPSGYWSRKATTPTATAWAGYAFEGICQKHIRQIKQALGISGINTNDTAWAHRPPRGTGQGAQIDLLIDRADDCITVCEMKFSNKRFVIDKKYARELESKLGVFKEVTLTRKTVFTVMVTSYGTRENAYYDQLVDGQVTSDQLFNV